jgi:hypothetical protein
MPSRWRTIAAFISGALFLAILILWVRSYFVSDQFVQVQVQKTTRFGTYDGAVGYTVQSYTPPLPSGWATWTYSSAYPYRRNGFFLSSLWAFHWGTRPRTYTIKGAAAVGATPVIYQMRVISISLPMWPLILVTAVLPVWVIMSRRGKVRWSVRDDITWMNFRLRSKLKRFAIFSGAGAAAGVLLGWVDQIFALWRNPWEWSLALLFLLPIVDFLGVLTRRRIPWRRGIVWMALEIAGFVCFFIATLQECWHIFGGWRLADVDLAPGALLLGAISFVIGAIILVLLQLKPHPVKPGPYCPVCGYCLIGSPRQICAECGRPFTLEELGVSEEELSPDSNLQRPHLNFEFRA